MSIKNLVLLAAITAFGSAASAATVTNWGTLGPVDQDARGVTTKAGNVDDVYTFSLGDYSDIDSTANYYTATSLSGVTKITLVNATLSLYSGVYGDSTADTLVGSYAFGTSMTDYTFSGLSAGNYYFEVTGTAGPKGSDYYFDVVANSATTPSVVPEPANVALLLAGLGLFGVMGKRSRSN